MALCLKKGDAKARLELRKWVYAKLNMYTNQIDDKTIFCGTVLQGKMYYAFELIYDYMSTGVENGLINERGWE